ncbi:MAG TPA: VanW family protein [Firmicutes bacterium]|nr:VanW family protein [Bacillota bacterium]
MQKELETSAGAPARDGRSKKPFAAVIAAAVILAAVLIPCVLAASSTTIYPRTTVAGIPVGGLTREEALDVLTAQLPEAFSEQSLPVTVQPGDAGESAEKAVFPLPLSALDVTASPAQAADAAYQNGRSGNFFTSGIAYAKGLLLGHAVAPELSFNRSAARDAIADIALEADVPVTECSWRIEGDSMIVTKPKSGYLIDQNALLSQVETALARYDLKQGVTCTLVETAPVSVTMEDIYGDAHRQAANAYYDKTEGAVKAGEPGVDFDPAAAQKQMDEAAPGAEFSVPITVTEPKISKEEMEKLLFRDQLGSCTTSVSGTSNRKHNVGLAAQSCNGIVLNPGETFSYNAALGERTAARGYRSAAAYVGGKTVLEYGGGICQVSSTLYLAVLRSNLEIVDRTNHMFYPGYIPYGMDATVSWGGPDFKFRNNTDYPIKIVASYSGGKATCTIYGTNTAGTSAKMTYSILSSTPYSTVTEEDSTLAPGESREIQNGYTGYKVVTYRSVYDAEGELISRTQEAVSTYRARDRIVHVGPAAETPEPDPAPEGDQPDAPDTPETPETPETPGAETAPGPQDAPASAEGENAASESAA